MMLRLGRLMAPGRMGPNKVGMKTPSENNFIVKRDLRVQAG